MIHILLKSDNANHKNSFYFVFFYRTFVATKLSDHTKFQLD